MFDVKPEVDVHEYELPETGDDPIVVWVPSVIDLLVPALTVGNGLSVMVRLFEVVHPYASVSTNV